ncbi:hypothetical protein Bca4012_064786 [Brassica carinata]
MKQIWAEKVKNQTIKGEAQEKLASLWSESIAEAAREGGSGEVELDWDSYEKAKIGISSEQKLQLAEEKARNTRKHGENPRSTATMYKTIDRVLRNRLLSMSELRVGHYQDGLQQRLGAISAV